MRISIYASNLHQGGAVGGAASLIDDFIDFFEGYGPGCGVELDLSVSNKVYSEMGSDFSCLQSRSIYARVVDERPSLGRTLLPSSRRADIRLTFRGPAYARRAASVEVAGFADRSLFVDSTVRGVRSVLDSARRGIKRTLLCRYRGFFCQTGSMAAELSKRYPARPIHVVSNRPSGVFLAAPTPMPRFDGRSLNVFYPARAYAHKNHGFVEEVADVMRRSFGIELNAVCTVTRAELDSLGVVPRAIVPVGPVGHADCLRYYKGSHAVLFPSLNETYSVTPLEAMAQMRPFICGDHGFMRETVGPHAAYFSPNDPTDAARVLLEVVQRDHGSDARLRDARRFVEDIPTGDERVEDYLRFMFSVAGESFDDWFSYVPK